MTITTRNDNPKTTLLAGALRTTSSILVSGEPLPIAELVVAIGVGAPLDLRNTAQVPDARALRAEVDRRLAASSTLLLLLGSEAADHVVQLVGEVAGSEGKRVVVLCATKTPPARVVERCALRLDAAKALSTPGVRG